MNFLDFGTGENFATTSKTFYQVWRASHLERVQRWMINGMFLNSQKYMLLDMENAKLKISLPLNVNRYLFV